MLKLKLKVTHTHAGAIYPAGHIIEVDETTARWIIERGIGVPVVMTNQPASDGAADVQPTSAAKTKSRNRSTKE